MITVKYLKKTAKEIINTEVIDEKFLVKMTLLLLQLADQLEYLEEKDTISDSQIGLLNTVTETWKDESFQCQHDLQEEREINAELRKQIAILKAALVH
jgi:hypothetical protein